MKAKGLCRSCYEKSRAPNVKYRIDGRSKVPGYKKQWESTPKGRECNRNAYTRYRFGISRDEYEALLLASGGVCGICKTPLNLHAPTNNPDSPVLDHDHSSNKIREFIHRRCNTAIALFKENAVTCRLAAEYLEKHRR